MSNRQCSISLNAENVPPDLHWWEPQTAFEETPQEVFYCEYFSKKKRLKYITGKSIFRHQICLKSYFWIKFQLWIGISNLREYDNHYIETDLLICWMAYPLITSSTVEFSKFFNNIKITCKIRSKQMRLYWPKEVVHDVIKEKGNGCSRWYIRIRKMCTREQGKEY